MASIKIKNPAYTEGGIEPKWLTIPMYAKMNPFEVLNITLMSNVPAPDRSMYGADITVVTADGIKILDTDWYGQPITLNIDAGVAYTVTASVSDCYTAQEEQSFTFTAASNNIRNLNIHYKANGIKVNMVTTTGASINKSATITYMSGDNEESVEVFHGEIAALPLGVEATITFPQIDGFDIPEPYTFTVTKDTVEYTATYSITGITKIRINNNVSDPASMITLIEDTGGIEKIRANSHRYTGQVVDGVMQLKQLKDDDGTKWLDGTTATITTYGIDVWMKLPQFWFKVEEYYTDIYDISFSISKVDNTWKEWDGKDLIAVYISTLNNDKVYSISKNSPLQARDSTNIRNYVSNRGPGFKLLQWKHHCMMAMLFYAYYRNTDFTSKNLPHYNTSGEVYEIGGFSNYGMRDSVYYETGSYSNANGVKIYTGTAYDNFWGLEHWADCFGACIIDNISCDSSGTIVTLDDGSTERLTIGSGYIKKIHINENMIVTSISGGGSDSTYFHEGTSSPNITDSYEIIHSHGDNGFNDDTELHEVGLLTISNAKIITDTSDYYDKYDYESKQIRLTYRGDWVIID